MIDYYYFALITTQCFTVSMPQPPPPDFQLFKILSAGKEVEDLDYKVRETLHSILYPVDCEDNDKRKMCRQAYS